MKDGLIKNSKPEGLVGYTSIPVWDWSKDWQANLDRDAYPDIRTLLAGRLAISILFPFSLLFLYLSARGIGGRIAGYSAIILLGLNALVLLHARRAMAEGPLSP